MSPVNHYPRASWKLTWLGNALLLWFLGFILTFPLVAYGYLQVMHIDYTALHAHEWIIGAVAYQFCAFIFIAMSSEYSTRSSRSKSEQ